MPTGAHARMSGTRAPGARCPTRSRILKPARRRERLPAEVSGLLRRTRRGAELTELEVASLFAAEGATARAVLRAADELRRATAGDEVTYVINRNINYTNICLYHCGFCAFSKGRSARSLRGPAYRLDLTEIAHRTREAHAAGATEVCLQGGIHPDYTGQTYLDIVAAVKDAVPDMHVHAFSPLEITHGAHTLGLSLESFLTELRAAGLSTLPGTAAEILDDEIRPTTSAPDKLTTQEWLTVMREAHAVGLRSTATIMFGHVQQPACTGRATCSPCAPCSARPAASPSSCRCRSCTWRPRCAPRPGTRGTDAARGALDARRGAPGPAPAHRGTSRPPG